MLLNNEFLIVFLYPKPNVFHKLDLNNTKYVANRASDGSAGSSARYHSTEKKTTIARGGYAGLVEASIRNIEAGVVEKIVPSTFKEVNLPEDFDLLKTFYRHCEKHPNAFVSLVSSPEVGTWLGASPELHQVLFQLRASELSSPLRIDRGFVVITPKVIQPAHAASLTEVYPAVLADYRPVRPHCRASRPVQ